jgi:hypothetical protein
MKPTAFILFFVIELLGCSTSHWSVPDTLQGNWFAEKTKVTVRTSKSFGSYQFTSDSVAVSLTIHDNNTVSGNIGNAMFSHVPIQENTHFPIAETAVCCVVQCGQIGKIFASDPLERKEVELWLIPSASDSRLLEAELRYTEGLAVFPMASIMLSKRD